MLSSSLTLFPFPSPPPQQFGPLTLPSPVALFFQPSPSLSYPPFSFSLAHTITHTHDFSIYHLLSLNPVLLPVVTSLNIFFWVPLFSFSPSFFYLVFKLQWFLYTIIFLNQFYLIIFFSYSSLAFTIFCYQSSCSFQNLNSKWIYFTGNTQCSVLEPVNFAY